MTSIDESEFKSTMRQLASGVTIITVCGADCGKGTSSGVHAMTATAFMPLSMTPPLILIAIEKRNDTHDMIANSGCFGVTLLSEQQITLSNRYARKDPDRYRFDDIKCFKGPNGGLFFEGCAAAIEAQVQEKVDAGDHTIFIGRIVWLKAEKEVKPLVYYQGKYQKLTPVETHA